MGRPARPNATGPRGRATPIPARPPSRAASLLLEPARALAARVRGFVGSLPERSLLDRLVRGRAWIPLLGLMLVGIVAMQVEVLKLGSSIGRSIERGSALTSENELLRVKVATLADDQRIERIAAGMGMIMPSPDAVGFLTAKRRAVGAIHAPNAVEFLSATTSNGAVATTPTTTAAATTPSTAATNATAATPAVSPSTGTSSSTTTLTTASQPTTGTPSGSASLTQPTSSTPPPTAQAPTTSQPPPATTTTPASTAPTQSGGIAP
jgi:cell division protein FtsL